jgi:hypothetical protein
VSGLSRRAAWLPVFRKSDTRRTWQTQVRSERNRLQSWMRSLLRPLSVASIFFVTFQNTLSVDGEARRDDVTAWRRLPRSTAIGLHAPRRDMRLQLDQCVGQHRRWWGVSSEECRVVNPRAAPKAELK